MPTAGPHDLPAARELTRKIRELQDRHAGPSWQIQLQDLTEEIQGEFSLKRLLERVMDRLILLTRAQRGFLILLQGRRLVFRVRRNIDRQTLNDPLSQVSTSIARRVVETGQPFVSHDAGQDTRLVDVPSVQALGLMSILAVPFRYEKKIIGVVYLDNRTSASAFAAADLHMIGAFAHAAANAIRVAELMTRLKRRIVQIDRLNRRLREDNRVQAAELRRTERHLARAEETLQRRYAYDAIVGQSPAMQRVFALLDQIVPREATTLITGETGTGKELIARAIHGHGPRKDKPFVAINCAALPEPLLESELFGHEKGAFTDAVSSRSGLVRQAHGGTLFLDEIGEMSPALQAKLLRVLQDRAVRPIGSAETFRVDVRWIAATHRDLAKMTAEALFRKDLYYRLSVLCIHLPPLRERLEDIPLLVRAMVERLHREQKLGPCTFDPGALEALARHAWPGNVRELENVVERLLAFGGRTVSRTQALRALGVPDRGVDGAPLPPDGLDLKARLDAVERDLLLAALRSAKSKSEAARRLRIDRTWFLRLLKKHRITGIEGNGIGNRGG